jgi:hypothetical protein
VLLEAPPNALLLALDHSLGSVVRRQYNPGGAELCPLLDKGQRASAVTAMGRPIAAPHCTEQHRAANAAPIPHHATRGRRSGSARSSRGTRHR